MFDADRPAEISVHISVSAEGESVSTLILSPLYPQEPLTDYMHLPQLVAAAATQTSYGVMAKPDYPQKPVQDGLAVISNARGIYKMTEFNSYGLVMNKQIVSHDEIVNGHVSQSIHIETLGQNLVLFFVTAQKFLEHISFGGPLQFRFKISNTRGKRALCGKQQATVLEDYLRLDRNCFLTEIKNASTDLLTDILHETAWSLGLPITPQDIRLLITQYLQEAQP